MKEGTDGLAADLPVAAAANQSFTADGEDLDGHAYQRPGWDPYEVWRTRVKTPIAKAGAAKAPAAKAPAAKAPAQAAHRLGPDPLTEALS